MSEATTASVASIASTIARSSRVFGRLRRHNDAGAIFTTMSARRSEWSNGRWSSWLARMPEGADLLIRPDALSHIDIYDIRAITRVCRCSRSTRHSDTQSRVLRRTKSINELRHVSTIKWPPPSQVTHNSMAPKLLMSHVLYC